MMQGTAACATPQVLRPAAFGPCARHSANRHAARGCALDLAQSCTHEFARVKDLAFELSQRKPRQAPPRGNHAVTAERHIRRNHYGKR